MLGYEINHQKPGEVEAVKGAYARRMKTGEETLTSHLTSF